MAIVLLVLRSTRAFMPPSRPGRRSSTGVPRSALRAGLRGGGSSSMTSAITASRRTGTRARDIGTGTGDWHFGQATSWPERSALADSALRVGLRGLPSGSSLPQVLAEHRGVRNHADLPPLSVDQVLAWADAFHERTGEWPRQKHWPEVIPDSGGETWGKVIQDISRGLRGFPGTGTLFDLLAEHRGVRNVGHLPPLTEGRILAWADAHQAAHGEWPTCRCLQQGIPDTGGERWFNVDQALRKGLRGLAGGSSLPKLLAKHRNVPNLTKGMAARMLGGKRIATSSPV